MSAGGTGTSTGAPAGADRRPGERLKVAVAWALVLAPLLWGVLETLRKAAQLFR